MKTYKCAALVIGNNNYIDNPCLKNAIADAELMASKFTALKYDVFLLRDCKADDFDTTFDDIIYKKNSEKKPFYDVVVLYFAGHGLMSAQSDYIVMVDAKDMLLHGGVPATHKSRELTKLYQQIRTEGIPIAIFIIDACRKDYSASGYSMERGVTTTFNEVGKNILLEYQTFLAFSTSPKAGAADGSNDHSAYTKALAEEILEPKPIESVFKNVRRALYSGPGSQLPWEHSCLVEEFCFNHGQLLPHYGSPYSPQVFTTDYQTNSDILIETIEMIQSAEGLNQLSLISQFRKGFSAMSVTDQFFLGRIFLNACGDSNKDFSALLSKTIMKSLSQDGANHFLNGMLYEIYFYEDDEFRGYDIAGFELLPLISRLCKDKDFSNSVEFIKGELGHRMENLFFLPGRKNPLNVYIELNRDIFHINEVVDIYTIDDVIVLEESIIDRLELTVYSRQSLREHLSRMLRIPQEDFECKFSRYGKGDDIYVIEPLEETIIYELLNEYFIVNTIDDLDSVSHHYEYGTLESLDTMDVHIYDSRLKIYCDFSISAVLYLDGEEEIESKETVSGHGIISIVQSTKGWIIENIQDLIFNTSSIYQ